MFTGIIEALGRVARTTDLETTRRFVIEAPAFGNELVAGDSVAVDGACLTVIEAGAEGFSVDVIGTTLERTIAGRYAPGTPVNLERAMKIGERLDGHIVQGHVDGVGHLTQVQQDGEFWLMDFRVPEDVLETTILHGSITLNGVSLTVSDFVGESGVQIGIIPFTYHHTDLGSLEVGDPVNVEADLIGKYVGRILSVRPS
ncbi:MAG: riboflavin synthase [Gemmatimonadetes bacterium]|nr:riboflavin synthase [Gemmatimonadota bacterium]